MNITNSILFLQFFCLVFAFVEQDTSDSLIIDSVGNFTTKQNEFGLAYGYRQVINPNKSLPSEFILYKFNTSPLGEPVYYGTSTGRAVPIFARGWASPSYSQSTVAVYTAPKKQELRLRWQYKSARESCTFIEADGVTARVSLISASTGKATPIYFDFDLCEDEQLKMKRYVDVQQNDKIMFELMSNRNEACDNTTVQIQIYDAEKEKDNRDELSLSLTDDLEDDFV